MKSALACLALLISCGPVIADEAATNAARQKAFTERLSNTTLTGSFTVDTKLDAPPKPERYEIEKVSRLTGNLYTFLVRIKYGSVDSRVPITVPVVWADGTPMISLTDQRLPGMQGKFSARVIFHGDRYVGTWQHDAVGGHMFGVIKKNKPADAEK
ncbi:MAG TPA: hypothetical protein DCG12_02870 [Planctomycetaceae bacterium]|nr:hypothetical protein [Planctomycetaceae bacterium]